MPPTRSQAAVPRELEVDLGALARNYQRIRRAVGRGPRIVPALKGNAYGHGAGPVAQRLAERGVDTFSTGSVADALAIRRGAPDARVLLFGGPLPQGLATLLEHDLTPTVYDRSQAEAVSDAASRDTGVAVKVDAGLGRLGVAVDDAVALVRAIEALPRLHVAAIYTHLPFDDAPGRDWAERRLRAFDDLLAAVEAAGVEVPITQALASAGILAGLKSRANAVCPGSLLFGISPVHDSLADAAEYEPVLTALRSWLIQVHAPGPDAGYGGLGAPARVGVIPLGLAHGFGPITHERGARARIGERDVPVVGASLEYTLLDLSDCADAREGDEVRLLDARADDPISLAELAARHGRVPHQLLMALNERIPYRYLD